MVAHVRPSLAPTFKQDKRGQAPVIRAGPCIVFRGGNLWIRGYSVPHRPLKAGVQYHRVNLL